MSAATELLDSLSDDELLALHREVCRRAAKVYGPRYAHIQRMNWETAMSMRDTRFVKGLSAMENIKRNMRTPREREAVSTHSERTA